MEPAIKTIVDVYLKSSKGKESLGKKEFQTLVKTQLSNILSDTDSKEAINNMAAGLDENHDGNLGFPEYMKLIGYLAISLSEQRALAKEESNQNATGQVAQTEANAEVKAEPKVEVREELAAAVPAVELNVEAPKVEAEGEVKTEIELPKEETTDVVVTTTTTTVVTEEINGEVTEVTEVTKVVEEVKEETVKAEDAPAAEEKKEETAS
ncbi:hypothetical protein NL108_009024 [Boleophthalmus pectinirostris]|uniref:S100 calcium binding protein U n=1 Tax=Boleophthalmus pectinirostris TaxID=150288 RepID=UPI00242F2FCF|nr:S100 calcium binding protein U [Boleophthalmus pectinirostris]KAJ0055091.1 hypothetical protein NL108_009024 [Boleophthalmus pectinirostris]